jgi:hypothetical protein
MPRLVKGKYSDIRSYVGREYTCRVNGNRYEIVEEDLRDIQERPVGHQLDERTIPTVACPCGGRIGFDSDYRGEAIFVHYDK